MKALLRVVDFITDASAWLAAALTGLIVSFFWLEVVLRYAFNRPTAWTGPFAQYLMLIVVMTFLPWLTREGHHVAMSLVFDRSPPWLVPKLVRSVSAICAATCLLSAWFCLNETIRQFADDARSQDAFLFPVWRLSAFMVFGLTFAAIHFLRQAFTGQAARQYEA